MKKGSKKKVLGRKVGPRKALMRALSQALVLHKRIVTTVAKAKALRPHIEKKILTKSVVDTLFNRRQAHRFLGNKVVTNELFQVVGPRIAQAKRPGGYTRVIKLSTRGSGDGSARAMIELVDFNTDYTRSAKRSKPRRRRKKKTVAGDLSVEKTTTQKVVDQPTDQKKETAEKKAESADKQVVKTDK